MSDPCSGQAPSHSDVESDDLGSTPLPAREDFRFLREGCPDLFARWRPCADPRALVVVIHGFGEHSGRYEHVFKALGGCRYATLAIDLRGFGQSGGHRAYIDVFDDYLDDVEAAIGLARERGPGMPVFLLGHSMGGLICTCLAQDRGRRLDLAGLAISSPAFGFRIRVPLWKDLLARVASRLTPRFSLPTTLDPAYFTHDAKMSEAARNDPLMTFQASARWFIESLASQKRALDPSRPVPCPLLVLVAGDDKIVEPAVEKQFIEETTTSDVESKVYEPLFHEIFNEVERDEVLGDLLAWLEKMTAQALTP